MNRATSLAVAPPDHPAPVSLPHSDRFFEIRFESIGGLGAHAAGQIFAAAAVLRMGLNAASFSSYGSEKKGSLVRSFVRLSPAERPIRDSAPVEAPDAIVVFHAALLRAPATFGGLRRDGVVIINAPEGAAPEALGDVPGSARVLRIDATAIALQEKSRPNAVLLGTLCAAFPFIDAAIVLDTLSEEFKGKNPEAVASNERAFRRGAQEFVTLPSMSESTQDASIVRANPVYGYTTQPPGGLVPAPGSTVWNDLSTSRTGWMPVLDRDKCIHCGSCDVVCPDFCLAWGDGAPGGKFERELLGVDYRYCKGCLRCVESCPTGAFTKQHELPGLAEQLRVPLFPELIK